MPVFVATAVLGVIEALKGIEGGSNGMHAYYEHKRGEIVSKLQAIEGMEKVADKWAKRFAADNPTGDSALTYERWHKVLDIRNVRDPEMKRLDRLYALIYTLNEWNGGMKQVSMPPFAVSTDDRGRVIALLRSQGFPQKAIGVVVES